jgi:undecaprenyl diphosphate synthase
MADENKIPRHIAVIMDGNGRWAKSRGFDRSEGHRSGVKSVRSTIDRCARLGVEFLTLYVFSAENWGRPKEEVEGLMELMAYTIDSEVPQLVENGIRMCIIGDRSEISPKLAAKLAEFEEKTAGGDKLTVLLAFNYGSRMEIARAARLMAEAVQRGEYTSGEITAGKLAANLYTAGWPDPDLLIRTGGEYRLSNFLLWQAAYSELYFTDVYWPDFDTAELDKAIAEYGNRERRFGKL